MHELNDLGMFNLKNAAPPRYPADLQQWTLLRAAHPIAKRCVCSHSFHYTFTDWCLLFSLIIYPFSTQWPRRRCFFGLKLLLMTMLKSG